MESLKNLISEFLKKKEEEKQTSKKDETFKSIRNAFKKKDKEDE